MPTPPFKPPDADSTRNPLPPAPPGSPLKAVLVGLATDIGGTTVLGVLIGHLYALQLHGQGMSSSEIDEAMKQLPHDSVPYVAGTLLGALMSVAGGYVCARIARRDEYRPGLVMAAISAAFVLLAQSQQDGGEMTLLFMVTGIACNLLGVKYGAARNRRDDTPPGPARDASTP